MDRKQIINRVEEIEKALHLIRHTKINAEHISGLKHSESFFLLLISTLNDGKPVTPTEAAEKLDVTMAAITHHINSLESQNYITRTLSEDDKRVWFINLTDKGKETIKIIKKEHRNKLSELIEYLGEKDSAKLIYLIEKISKFFKEKTKNPSTQSHSSDFAQGKGVKC